MEPVANLVGRHAELTALRSWLAAADGVRAHVIEGQPGIGKTALLTSALRLATGEGWRVLSAAPTIAEERLSYSALTDLLDPVADMAFEGLAPVQRRAVEAALLRTEAAQPPDPRTVGMALLGCLRLLAGEPLMVAVDDVQWIDRPSAAALEFAFRRLRAEPVALLLARRGTPAEAPPLGLEPSCPAGERLTRAELRPLGPDAMTAILSERLGWSPGRPTTSKVTAAVGGNPLFGLEVAREMRRRGWTHGDPLPIPARVLDLVAGHLAEMSATTRAPLLAAAMLSRPTIALLNAAGYPDVLSSVDAGVTAGILEPATSERLRFAHPIYPSALYATASASERHETHARLALVATDPEERARHLALAATRPDAGVANLLDRAASGAARRGAPSAAAELLRLGAELTPREASDDRFRRLLAAVEHHLGAGDGAAARELLAELETADTASAEVRTAALLQRAGIELRDRGPAAAAALAEQALERLGERAGPQHARALLMRGVSRLAGLAPVSDAIADLRRVRDVARASNDARLHAQAQLFHEFARVVSGHGSTAGELEASRDPALGLRGHYWHGAILVWTGAHEAARAWLESYIRHVEELGDDYNRMFAEHHLGELAWRTGQWGAAEEHLRTALSLAEGTGQAAMAPTPAAHLAALLAATGRTDEAEDLLDRWEPTAEEAAYLPAIGFAAWARGLLALTRGSPAPTLASTLERIDAVGFHEEAAFPLRAELAELLVAAGEHEQALRVATEMEGRAQGFPAFTCHRALRVRAAAAASAGALEEAFALGEQALAVPLAMPFEIARTRLLHGVTLRRLRRKRAARDLLEAAVEGFQSLGAGPWAARARAEVARTGIRQTESLELTPTEERVAALAAAGRSNKEIAVALSVALRTVETNLTRIYRKLGISRRAELIRMRAGEALEDP